MYHHGTEDYKVATSNAAKVMRNKLEGLFNRGRNSVKDTINSLMDTWNELAGYLYSLVSFWSAAQSHVPVEEPAGTGR